MEGLIGFRGVIFWYFFFMFWKYFGICVGLFLESYNVIFLYYVGGSEEYFRDFYSLYNFKEFLRFEYFVFLFEG